MKSSHPKPKRRWLRWFVRVALVLAATITGLLLYGEVLALFLVQAHLRENYRVEITIDELELGYFTGLTTLRGIEIDGTEAQGLPIRALKNGELVLEYSLWGGIVSVDLSADVLELDLLGSAGNEDVRAPEKRLALPTRLPPIAIAIGRLEAAYGEKRLSFDELEGRVSGDGHQEWTLVASKARCDLGFESPESALLCRGQWHAGAPSIDNLDVFGIELESARLDAEARVVRCARIDYVFEEERIAAREIQLPLASEGLANFLQDLQAEVSIDVVQVPQALRDLPKNFGDVWIETFEEQKGRLTFDGRIGAGRIEFGEAKLATHSGLVNVREGSFRWEGLDFRSGDLVLAMDVDLPDLSEVERFFDGLVGELRGALHGKLDVRGPPLELVGEMDIEGEALRWAGRPLGSLVARLRFDGDSIATENLRVALDPGNYVELDGSYHTATKTLEDVRLEARLEGLEALQLSEVEGGGLSLVATLNGALESLQGEVQLDLDDLVLRQRTLREVSLQASLAWPEFEVRQLRFNDPLGFVEVVGSSSWDGKLERFEARLDSLRAVRGDAELHSVQVAMLRVDPMQFELGPLQLEGSGGTALVEYRQTDAQSMLNVELESFDPLPLVGAILPGDWRLGRLTGNVKAMFTEEESSIDAQLALSGLAAPGDTTQGWNVDFVTQLEEKRLSVERVEARHTEYGSLGGGGEVPLSPFESEPLPAGDLNFHLELQGFQIAHLTRRLSRGLLELEGPMNGFVNLGGTWDAPLAELELQHAGVYFKEGLDSIRLGPAQLDLHAELSDRLSARFDFGHAERFEAHGEVALEGGLDVRQLLAEGPRPWMQTRLSGTAKVVSRGIEDFMYRYEGLPRLHGAAEASLRIEGSLEEPEWSAALLLKEGGLNLGIDGVPRLTALQLELRADQEGIQIVDSGGAEMGGAPLWVRGGATFAGGLQLDLRLQGEEVLLRRVGGMKLRADIDLGIQGGLDALQATGEVALTDCRFVRNFDPLSFLGREEGSLASERGFVFEISDSGPLSTAVFDLAVTSKEPFMLKNNFVNGSLRPELALIGSGLFPELRGEIYIDSTGVKLPGGRFEVQAGTIQFRRNEPHLPHIELSGEAFVQGYRIDVQMSGPVGDAELFLSSNPPLPNEDILVLLLTGQLPEGTTGQEAVRLVAVYLAQDLVSRWFSDESTEDSEGLEAFAERFDYWSGVDPIRTGIETHNVSLRLSSDPDAKRIHSLVGEQDAFEDINLGYRILFRLR